jgi:very-short-patch-repair endonuclease
MARLHYKKYSGITLLARRLRKNQTPSEKLLWEELRRKKLSGYKFLRQHPVFYRIDAGWVEFFVADFYCAKLNLIIELDSKIHLDRVEYDSQRDSKLFNKGIHVIRFKNEELNDMEKVIIRIDETIEQLKIQINDNEQNSSHALIV